MSRAVMRLLYIFYLVYRMVTDSHQAFAASQLDIVGQHLPPVELDKICTAECEGSFRIYKLRGLSPRANYTDRAAAAGRRS